jgi:hypothetical protein
MEGLYDMDNRDKRLLECLERRKQKLEIVEQSKKAIGKSAYVKFLKGETLTQRQAIQAMCYECMGYYEDGDNDCENCTCPLYLFMPFNKYKIPFVKSKGKSIKGSKRRTLELVS